MILSSLGLARLASPFPERSPRTQKVESAESPKERTHLKPSAGDGELVGPVRHAGVEVACTQRGDPRARVPPTAEGGGQQLDLPRPAAPRQRLRLGRSRLLCPLLVPLPGGPLHRLCINLVQPRARLSVCWHPLRCLLSRMHEWRPWLLTWSSGTVALESLSAAGHWSLPGETVSAAMHGATVSRLARWIINAAQRQDIRDAAAAGQLLSNGIGVREGIRDAASQLPNGPPPTQACSCRPGHSHLPRSPAGGASATARRRASWSGPAPKRPVTTCCRRGCSPMHPAFAGSNAASGRSASQNWPAPRARQLLSLAQAQAANVRPTQR